jgi:uncharacterized repeat protein (TIGR03803 family)
MTLPPSHFRLPTSHFVLRARRLTLSLFLLCFATAWVVAQSSPPYTDLHDFGGKVVNTQGKVVQDGIFPNGGVAFDTAGNMFGTTYQGGAYGNGMVWEITAAGVYKDLHDFGGTIADAIGRSSPDGVNPAAAPALDQAGNLYGSTFFGGPNLAAEGGAGILWKISNTGKYQDLHDFGATLKLADGQKAADGANPFAQVVVSANGQTLMGTAESAGSYNGGVLWEISPAGGYAVLHSFGGTLIGSHVLDGACPTSNIVFDIAGNACGTCEFGGGQLTSLGGGGMLWKLSPTGVYFDAADFGGAASYGGEQTASGRWPVGPITIFFGIIFGTCSAGGPAASTGGAGFGTFWADGGDSYDFGGTTINTNGKKGPDGAYPTGMSYLTFGTTMYGGLYDQEDGGDGIVWQQTLLNEDLHDFGGTIVNANGKKGPDGIGPAAPPAADIDWNLVGTTQFGGPNGVATGGDGMIWRITTAMTGLTLYSTQVIGGASVSGLVTLAVQAPKAGIDVGLKSSSVSATVSSPLVVGPQRQTQDFAITTKPVAVKTSVTITATEGGVTKTGIFTIVPPSVSGVAVSPNPVVGGTSCTGNVHLNGVAPAGGTTITLTSSSKLLVVPSKVVVPSGTIVAQFPVTVSAVAGNETATIYAKTGSPTQTATITIEPASLTSIAITPLTFVGGSTTQVTGKVVLNAPAPAGGAVVSIISSLPAAVAVPTTVTIPAAGTSASFVLKHYAVSKDQIVTITAKYGKTPKSIALNVTS